MNREFGKQVTSRAMSGMSDCLMFGALASSSFVMPVNYCTSIGMLVGGLTRECATVALSCT